MSTPTAFQWKAPKLGQFITGQMRGNAACLPRLGARIVAGGWWLLAPSHQVTCWKAGQAFVSRGGCTCGSFLKQVQPSHSCTPVCPQLLHQHVRFQGKRQFVFTLNALLFCIFYTHHVVSTCGVGPSLHCLVKNIDNNVVAGCDM